MVSQSALGRALPEGQLSPGVTVPGALCPVLGCSFKEGQETIGDSPVEGNKND